MATETLYATSHITGDCPSPTNALSSADGTWAGPTTNNVAWTSRWALGDTVDPLTTDATQSVAVRVRKTNHSTNPTCAISLYESGSLIGELQAATAVSSTSGVDHTVQFNSSAISNPANVEIEVVGAVGGGNPGNRASLQIDSITWTADTAVAAKQGSTSHSVTVAFAPVASRTAKGVFSPNVATTFAPVAQRTAKGSVAFNITLASAITGEIPSQLQTGSTSYAVSVDFGPIAQRTAKGSGSLGIVTTFAPVAQRTTKGSVSSAVSVDFAPVAKRTAKASVSFNVQVGTTLTGVAGGTLTGSTSFNPTVSFAPVAKRTAKASVAFNVSVSSLFSGAYEGEQPDLSDNDNNKHKTKRFKSSVIGYPTPRVPGIMMQDTVHNIKQHRRKRLTDGL